MIRINPKETPVWMTTVWGRETENTSEQNWTIKAEVDCSLKFFARFFPIHVAFAGLSTGLLLRA